MAANFLWNWLLQAREDDPSIFVTEIPGNSSIYLLIDGREIAYDIAATLARSSLSNLPGDFQKNLRRVPKDVLPNIIKKFEEIFPKSNKEVLQITKNKISVYLDELRNVILPNTVGIVMDGVVPNLAIDNLRSEVLLRNFPVIMATPGTYASKIIDQAVQSWLSEQYGKNISTFYSGYKVLGECDSKMRQAIHFYLSNSQLNTSIVIYSGDDRIILSMLEYYGKNKQADIYIRRSGSFLSISAVYKMIRSYIEIPTFTLLTAFLPGNCYLPPLLGDYNLNMLIRIQQKSGQLSLVEGETGLINWPNLRIFMQHLSNYQLDSMSRFIEKDPQLFAEIRKGYYQRMLLPANWQLFPVDEVPNWKTAMLNYAEALQWYVARTISYSENLNYSFTYPYSYAPFPVDLRDIPEVTKSIWLPEGPRLTLLDQVLLVISQPKGLEKLLRGNLSNLNKIGEPLAALFPQGAIHNPYQQGQYIFPKIDHRTLKMLQIARSKISPKSQVLKDYLGSDQALFKQVRYG